MGPEHLAVIESTMSSSLVLGILKSNARPFVWLLKLGWNWVMQQNNDPEYNTVEKERIKVLQWCSQKSRRQLDWNA